MNRIAQRILKQVAVYVPSVSIGNTRRSGDWLHAERPKNDLPYQTPQEEYNAIKQYIREYEREIADLKKQLELDPNNQELLQQLKDKQQRKRMFEEDIHMSMSQEVIDYDEKRKKEKEELERKLTQERAQYQSDVQSRKEEKKSRNEQMLNKLPEYLQELVSDAKNYTPHIHKGYISSSKQEFKQKLYTAYCKYLNEKANQYLSANKCSKSGEYGLQFLEIINSFIKQLPVNIVNKFIDRFYIVDSGESLLYYLKDTDLIKTTVIPNLLGSIQYALRHTEKSTDFFSTSNIRNIITKKIITMWNANRFEMIARKTHDGTKYYVPFHMPLEQLNVIVEYLINETNIVGTAKRLLNK